jgi:replication factor C subunit 2/4
MLNNRSVFKKAIVNSDNINSDNVNSDNVNSDNVNSDNVNSDNVNSDNVNSDNFNSDNVNSENRTNSNQKTNHIEIEYDDPTISGINMDLSEMFDFQKILARKKKQSLIHTKKYIPFIEKYRPRDFNDLILPLPMQYKIANIIETKILPNIIITGSPGTGKTSTILCLARKVLGNDYKDMLLELNASNNRTLDFINTTVAYFCKKKLSSNTDKQKLIIFDEADNITKKAQNLLANLMEEHAYNTSFAFTCNESGKIIESIQSRCIILRYVPMTSENIKKRLTMICQKENISYDDEGLSAINFISQGDVRQAINNLEATYHGYKTVTDENVYKLCYHPHPKIVVEIIKECVNMNIIKGIEYIHELKNCGYCTNDILQTLLNSLREIKIDEDIRINFIKIISDAYINVSEGVDSNLQLYGCISRMIKYIQDTMPEQNVV